MTHAEKMRQWRAANPEKWRAAARRQRASRKARGVRSPSKDPEARRARYRLTQNLYLSERDIEVIDGRLRNKVTGTFPQILHAAGQSRFPEGLA